MEIYTEIVNMLGKPTLSITMVCNSANLFKSSRTNFEDDPHKEAPKTVLTSENVAKI